MKKNKLIIVLCILSFLIGISIIIPCKNNKSKEKQINLIIENSNLENAKETKNCNFSGKINNINNVKIVDNNNSKYIKNISDMYIKHDYDVKKIKSYNLFILNKNNENIDTKTPFTVYADMDIMPIISEIKKGINWEMLCIGKDGVPKNITNALVSNNYVFGHNIHFEIDKNCEIIIILYEGGAHSHEQ